MVIQSLIGERTGTLTIGLSNPVGGLSINGQYTANGKVTLAADDV